MFSIKRQLHRLRAIATQRDAINRVLAERFEASRPDRVRRGEVYQTVLTAVGLEMPHSGSAYHDRALVEDIQDCIAEMYPDVRLVTIRGKRYFSGMRLR